MSSVRARLYKIKETEISVSETMDSTSRFVNGVKNPLHVVLDVLQESGFLDVDSKEPVVRFLHPQELQVSEEKRKYYIINRL